MTYTSVFGGTTLYPSDVSYAALVLGGSVALEWPLESSGGTPAARIIDVRAGSSSRTVTFPDATMVAPGQTILVNSLATSSQTFTVLDHAGGTLASITAGTQWQFYLADTSTAAGTWRVFQFGASTTTAQASALAGYGLVAQSALLSQTMTITEFSSSPRTVASTDRAAMLTWTSGGAGTLNLPAAASVGNGFFASARNSGGGALTIDPYGAELIDGASTLVLQPGESATFGTEGSTWYSLGFGQSAVFAFDYLDIDVGGLSGTLTLSGTQLNRTAYRFHGALAGDLQVVVPPTIQQYWVDNSTSGAFVLTLNTATGSPAVTTAQGQRNIYYCNGSVVVTATTAAVAGTIPATQGGTGQTAYTIGDLLAASSSVALTKLPAVATGNALISAGVGALPVWGAIGLGTHVSGTLPVANGGTNGTTAAAARTSLGAAASGANGDITSFTALTSALVSGSGGLGYSTGSGGTVAQATSRTTGVTINKTNGAITLFSVAGSAAWQSFTVTNSTVAATDNVRVCQQSGTDLYQIHVTNVAAGSFRVSFATTGGTTVEAPVFNFAVVKAVAA